MKIADDDPRPRLGELAGVDETERLSITTTSGISHATPNTSIMRMMKLKYSAPVTQVAEAVGHEARSARSSPWAAGDRRTPRRAMNSGAPVPSAGRPTSSRCGASPGGRRPTSARARTGWRSGCRRPAQILSWKLNAPPMPVMTMSDLMPRSSSSGWIVVVGLVRKFEDRLVEDPARRSCRRGSRATPGRAGVRSSRRCSMSGIVPPGAVVGLPRRSAKRQPCSGFLSASAAC